VAIHAGLGGRQAGERRMLHGAVAIAAVNAQDADMMLVAKGNRLNYHLALPRAVGRTGKDVANPKKKRDKEKTAEDAYPGKGIHASVENLRHCRLVFAGPQTMLMDIAVQQTYEARSQTNGSF
jgi:hypothetical protein